MQRQALGEVPGADPGRIEGLEHGENALDVVQAGRQRSGGVFQRGADVAIGFDKVDQVAGDDAVFGSAKSKLRLFGQVIGKRLHGRERGVGIVIVAGWRGLRPAGGEPFSRGPRCVRRSFINAVAGGFRLPMVAYLDLGGVAGIECRDIGLALGVRGDIGRLLRCPFALG